MNKLLEDIKNAQTVQELEKAVIGVPMGFLIPMRPIFLKKAKELGLPT